MSTNRAGDFPVISSVRHSPEQIVSKLNQAATELAEGKKIVTTARERFTFQAG